MNTTDAFEVALELRYASPGCGAYPRAFWDAWWFFASGGYLDASGFIN